jgi:hypothetical protein
MRDKTFFFSSFFSVWSDAGWLFSSNFIILIDGFGS